LIALITSTLKPTNIYSQFSDEQRYGQTIFTINSLYEKGFNDVILIDNSNKHIDLNQLIKDTNPLLKAYHTPQYSFENKGLNEALLILNNLDKLPVSTPIFKISARYYPNNNFKLDDLTSINKFDFIGVGQGFNQKIPYFSTRAYIAQNKQLLEKILVLAIEEMLSYHKGVYGMRSFINLVKSFFIKSLGSSYQLSLEQAFALILKNQKNYFLLEKIHISGVVAGFNEQNSISE
jgi:hypothetical protein